MGKFFRTECMEKYNREKRPKELGFFGDENNLEWKQYQLNEEGALVNSQCPLNINKKGEK